MLHISNIVAHLLNAQPYTTSEQVLNITPRRAQLTKGRVFLNTILHTPSLIWANAVDICFLNLGPGTMSSARVNVLAAKTGKRFTTMSRLCNLLPTNKVFVKNIKCVHHQAEIWRGLKNKVPQTGC